MKYSFLLAFTLMTFVCFSQKKKEIKKLGIKSQVVTETVNGKVINDSKTVYDKNGQITEDWNYDKDGHLKSITKYTYNKDGNVIGQIKWYSRMRGYGFLPTPDCNDEIKEFIKDLMKKRREEK